MARKRKGERKKKTPHNQHFSSIGSIIFFQLAQRRALQLPDGDAPGPGTAPPRRGQQLCSGRQDASRGVLELCGRRIHPQPGHTACPAAAPSLLSTTARQTRSRRSQSPMPMGVRTAVQPALDAGLFLPLTG